MKKKNVFRLVLELVFIVLFNLVFFVVGGTKHPASVWISYTFIHLAYLLLLATPYLTRKIGNHAVLGMPIYTVSGIYFAAELVVGLFFILLAFDKATAALLIQVVLFGAYIAVLMSVLLVNEHTADNLERQKAETAFIRNASSRVKLLADKIKDRKLSKEVERVYDALHAASSRSGGAAYPVENAIMDRIADMEKAVSDGDIERVSTLSAELQSLIRERTNAVRTQY